MLGNNMFAYCRNNPVCRKDISGTEDLTVFFDDGSDGTAYNEPIDPDDACANSKLGTQTGGYVGGGARGNTNGLNSSPSHQSNPLENIQYTDKVLNDMQKADFHGFSEIVDNYGALGETFQAMGRDGMMYTHLHIWGSYLGHDGYFEYMWDGAGNCNHRFFKATDFR